MTATAQGNTGVRRTASAWTPDTVRRLGMTTDIATAGEILNIGRSKSYELAKTGEFPVKVLRIGRRYIVPVAAVVRLLEDE